MKFLTNVKAQIFHVDFFFFAVMEVGSCSIHCNVLKMQSSFSRSSPVSISSALVHSLVKTLFHRLPLSKGTQKPSPAFLLFLLTPAQCVCLCLPESYIEIAFFVHSSLLFIGGGCHIRVKLELSQPQQRENQAQRYISA